MEGFEKRGEEIALVSVLLLCLILLIFQNLTFLTGNATQGEISSNVSVSRYYSISFGSNMLSGIQFGNVAFLPATNINATHNYDGASSGTTYTIDVSTDSNSNVDFCTKANTGLTNPALDVIGLGNETYSAENSTTASVPALGSQTSLTTGYVKAQNITQPGNSSYWRFWLDIPAAQPSGDYNNTVYFKGVVSWNFC